MKELGAAVLIRTLQGLVKDTITAQPQDMSRPSRHAPKLFTENSRIDFNVSVRQVHNLVRGLSPFPGAFTMLHGKNCKIFRSEKETRSVHEVPGTPLSDHKTYLKFACADGYLSVTELQLEGKKRMKIEEFLKGYRFPSTAA